MVSVLPAALLGFVVGLRHAMDADHVAAVGTIVARERNLRGAALVGAAWGLGHTLSLLLVGGAIIVFELAVPRRVGLFLELGVGVMLLGLGLWNFASRRHGHPASAPAEPHAPASPPASLRRTGALTPWLSATIRPLLVGGVHGLAGSAAAALVVVAAAGRSSWGIAYLLVFGLGTMLGMVALTTALAMPMGRALERFRSADLWVRLGSGALSLCVGALVVYEVGVRDGLFR